MVSARRANATGTTGPSGPGGRRPVERRVLHFDLSHLDEGGPYVLHACLLQHPLQRHTPSTRERARRAMAVLRAVPDPRLTHFVELDLPSDAVALLRVTSPRPSDGAPRTATMAIHIPAAVYRAEQRRQQQAGSVAPAAVHPKLATLGVTGALFRQLTGGNDPAPYPPHIESYQDATAAAVALLFHHRDVMNLALDQYGAAYVIATYLEANPSISDVAIRIKLLGEDWMTPTPVLDEHGQQMTGDDGKPLWTQTVDPDVRDAMRGPLQWALRQIKDDPRLEGKQWRAQFATTASDYGAVSNLQGPDEPQAAATLTRGAPAQEAGAGSVTWTLQNVSPGNGLVVDPAIAYQPAPNTSAWTGSGFWSQPESQAGQAWPAAQQLLAGRVYLKVTTADHSRAPVLARLVPGSSNPNDRTTPLTVDLRALGPSSTATISLNAMQTSMAYRLSLQGEALGSGNVNASFCDADGTSLYDLPLSDASGYASLTITCTNQFVRHLGIYAQFLDQGGRAIDPADWDEQLPDFIRPVFQPDPTKKYLGMLPPSDTVCGIPLPPEPTTLTVPIPGGASSVRLLWGGLGIGQYDHGVCGIGITCTVVVELALPIIMLVAGAVISDSRPVQALLADKDLLYRVCGAGALLVEESVMLDIVIAKNPWPFIETLAKGLGPLLLKTGLKWFITKQLAKAAAEQALPAVDLGFRAFNTAVTIMQLSQTTIEVLASPFVFETDLRRTVDVQVTLEPDGRSKQFPPASIGGHYTVYVMYDNDATYGAVTHQLPDTTQSDPIVVTFRRCPAAGSLKVCAFFYAPNGWQAGQGASGWQPAVDAGGLLVIPALEVVTNDLPLSSASVYQHKQKIAYQPAGGAPQHVWVAADAPTATMTTGSPYLDQHKQLTFWTGITMAQAPAQLAYSYQASGLDMPPSDARLYTVENLSVLQHPEARYAALGGGLVGKAHVVYDLVASDDGRGRNFLIDPSRGQFDPTHNPAGGSHLRLAALSSAGPSPSFTTSTDHSWGRFVLDNDAYAVHPKGYVVGISYATGKLEVLKLPTQPSHDADAPLAFQAAGAGSHREGLLHGPRAMGITLDGRILVLETLANRIQAFAVDGTPVRCFGTAAEPCSWTPLREQAGVSYLDLAVEAKGYIYVLGFTGQGRDPGDYFVDVYDPDGSWLVRTSGVTAAQITVDLLRSMYTLNYEIILGPGGRPEPSISMWLPPPPAH